MRYELLDVKLVFKFYRIFCSHNLFSFSVCKTVKCDTFCYDSRCKWKTGFSFREAFGLRFAVDFNQFSTLYLAKRFANK